jgi:hypothetical protein
MLLEREELDYIQQLFNDEPSHFGTVYYSPSLLLFCVSASNNFPKSKPHHELAKLARTNPIAKKLISASDLHIAKTNQGFASCNKARQGAISLSRKLKASLGTQNEASLMNA